LARRHPWRLLRRAHASPSLRSARNIMLAGPVTSPPCSVRLPSLAAYGLPPNPTCAVTSRLGSHHAEVGVRDRAAAGTRDEADPRQLGGGRLGAGGRHPRAQHRATRRVPQAPEVVAWEASWVIRTRPSPRWGRRCPRLYRRSR